MRYRKYPPDPIPSWIMRRKDSDIIREVDIDQVAMSGKYISEWTRSKGYKNTAMTQTIAYRLGSQSSLTRYVLTPEAYKALLDPLKRYEEAWRKIEDILNVMQSRGINAATIKVEFPDGTLFEFESLDNYDGWRESSGLWNIP